MHNVYATLGGLTFVIVRNKPTVAHRFDDDNIEQTNEWGEEKKICVMEKYTSNASTQSVHMRVFKRVIFLEALNRRGFFPSHALSLLVSLCNSHHSLYLILSSCVSQKPKLNLYSNYFIKYNQVRQCGCVYVCMCACECLCVFVSIEDQRPPKWKCIWIDVGKKKSARRHL